MTNESSSSCCCSNSNIWHVSQNCLQPIIFKNMEIVLYFTNVKSFCLCKSCIKGKQHKEWAPQEGAIRTSLLQVSIIYFHIYMVSNAMNCPCKLRVIHHKHCGLLM
jgi:hypothetical protein